MKIIIYAPNINLLPGVSDYLEKKINVLDKFLPREQGKDFERSLTEIRIKIERESAHNNLYRIGAEVILPKQVIAVSAQGQDIFKAIDQIKDKLRRELRKYGGRRDAVHLRARRAFKRMRLWTGERVPKGKRERHE
jgi:ribosomal subunit interface protein